MDCDIDDEQLLAASSEDPTMSSAHEGEEPTIKPVSDVLIK